MSLQGPSYTRFSHLYRLCILFVVFFVVAALVRWWATPASWNYEFDRWYRLDAEKQEASSPLVYGGNESCKECHAAADKKLNKFHHKKLSCESCHGPLADHVREGKKIAAAIVDRSRWQCENCHLEQINRPKGFPQFSKTGQYGKFVRKHSELDDKTLCLQCHDAHDPTP